MWGSSKGHVEEIAQSMRDYGWYPDSVLLIMSASEEDKAHLSNPELCDVYDGNIRTRAALKAENIDFCKSRYIKMPEGCIFHYSI